MDSGERYPKGPLLRRIEQIDDPDIVEEQFLKLSNARVALINYHLLQHDFPFLRDEAILRCHPQWHTLTPEKKRLAINHYIKQWLLFHGAIISSSQAKQQVVNTPIPHTGEFVTAYRPPRYRRACVVPCGHGIDATQSDIGGLIDIKGVGLPVNEVPGHGDHCDGLSLLGRLLRDTAMQWLIDDIFKRVSPGLWTVPVYGVIDCGFDFKMKDKPGTTPAGIQVRRAHRRPLRGVELPDISTPLESLKFETEMLLRSFGVTSSSVAHHIELYEKGGKLKVIFNDRPMLGYSETELKWIRKITGYQSGRQINDVVNIQMTREFGYPPPQAQLVDFEHFAIREDFDKPLVSLVLGHLLMWGGVLRTDDDTFIRPDANIRVNFKNWGLRRDWTEIEPLKNIPFEKASRIDSIAFRLAREFRHHQIDENQLRRTLQLEVSNAFDGTG